MVPEDLVKKVETQYLKIIIANLKSGSMAMVLAKETAQLFLTYLPFTSIEDMRAKLNSFWSKYPVFQTLELIVATHEESKKTEETLEKMRTLMNNNQIDEALNLAK